MAAVRARVEERFPADLERVRDYLRMPSISATGQGIREVAHAAGNSDEECRARRPGDVGEATCVVLAETHFTGAG